MTSVRSALGLGRSLAIYYGQPHRTRNAQRFYRSLLKPGDLAFDIGAHVGSRARAMRTAGARVVAVEPQPLFFAFLRRTLPRDIELCSHAVGAEEGEARLLISERHPTVSSIASDWVEEIRTRESFSKVRWDTQRPVHVTTLDRLIAKYGSPAYCKIDVEGAEPNVLQGLSVAIPLVSFEYVPGAMDRAITCIARLDRLGTYRFNRVCGESFTFASPTWITGAEMAADCRGLTRGKSGDVYAKLEG